MSNEQEDHIAARILEAEMAIEPVASYLELTSDQIIAGNRDQAEAFVANAPSLYGYERDVERIFMTLDIAVSAVQSDPTYGGGYSLIAACLYRLGVEDFDKFDSRALTAAIPWANRARVVDPDYDLGWEIYVECHCYKGDFKTAEKALGEIYKQFGDNDLYARTAFLYFRLQGETAQAVNWGALAWQTEWDTTRLIHTLFALGQLYRDIGEFNKALDAYRVITERDHENAWAFHYAARCAAGLDNFKHALELNNKALALGEFDAFRDYAKELKQRQARTRLGKRVTTIPPTRKQTGVRKRDSKVVPPPPAKSDKVVPAPPPAKPPGKVVKAPPPTRKKRPNTQPPPKRRPPGK